MDKWVNEKGNNHRETDGQIFAKNICGKSVKSLIQGRWLSDEIIHYCTNHLHVMFCGSCIAFKILILPRNFLGAMFDLHNHDEKVALETENDNDSFKNFPKQPNILEYDNVILVNKSKNRHWNLFVIFPQMKRIELVDSSDPIDDDIKLFEDIWAQLWMYCQLKDLRIDTNEWKFVHSRTSIDTRQNSSLCGIYTIMHMVAIMHRVNPNQCTDQVCEYMRTHLMFYFITHKNDTVINKCLLPSWKGSKKRKPAVPKPAVVSQGTQPSQNPDSKEDDKKNDKESTPKKTTKKKKDRENSDEDEGEFEFDDDTACIEYIKTSYYAKPDRESTWELPDNSGRRKHCKLCELDNETLNKLYAMPRNNLTKKKETHSYFGDDEEEG